MTDEQQRLVTQLGQFTVCQLADALGSSSAIETSLIPIDQKFRISGLALTVECAPGDNLAVHRALHLAEPGEVLIVAGSPSCQGALWGELMSISAQERALAGTIVDGPARDSLEIQALGYPVFCRRFDPRRVNKEALGCVNVPVHVGVLEVRPGDFILADVNGIVSLPPGRVCEAIALASEIAQKETRIKTQLRAGSTLFEILNLEQYIPRGAGDASNSPD